MFHATNGIATVCKEVLDARSAENTVTPNTDAAAALSKMVSSGRSRLMVGEDEHLAGIVSLKDLMGLPALKTDLDGGGFPRSAVTR